MIMKKVALFVTVLLITASISFAKADTFETPSAIDHAIEMFVSNWSTDGAQTDIQFSNGYFQVHIETFDGGYESNKWAYLCTYDEHHQALVASNTGTKITYTYDHNTDCETESIAYHNGSAVFTLHPDGYLMWLDETAHAGEDLLFTKVGGFSGVWHCENISINFHLIGNAYRCTVSENDGDRIISQWVYYCKYDSESGNLISDSTGRKEVLIAYDEDAIYDKAYDDGSAVFSINSDGYLLWNDQKENAGANFLFAKNSE